jgi:osmotically-inducible protein OsmY
MQRSDTEIKTDVERTLHESSLVDDREIQVAARDAAIILRGAVDSTIEKRRARQMAEDTPGVRVVHDHVTVKNWVARPDDELAEAVRRALLRDAYTQGARIEVRASRGEIVLDGGVPDYHTRKAAEDVAWWTPGVINVENLLLVADEEFVDVSPLEVMGQ